MLRWNKVGVTIAGSGVAGKSNDQLDQPRDAIWATPNRVYIADYANHRIQKYSIGTSTGSTIAGQTNGISGNISNYLAHPSRVLVDSNDAIYVADSDNHRIQFWSNGGGSGVTIAGSSAGISGSSNSQLHTPVGLALESGSNTLYISDFHNDRVMRYSSGASSGTVVAGGNGFGLNYTQLWRPSGLYFDSFTNSFIIANSNAQNIVRWVLGASSWSFLGGSTNAISGNNATLLRYPIDVTLDPMGNIYIADRNNHRIQLLMVGQTEAITIAGVSNLLGTNASLLNTPYAVRLDDQLNLYVADSQNHRIQMFSRY